MGGGGGEHSGSMFRVGDNVTLARVLTMMSVLIVFVMVLEVGLHKLGHHLHKYPKYHEMMNKVFGELMILGLIGLSIKVAKEVSRLDAYSPSMIAFQAADLTVFLVAIALILQAIAIFLRLRHKNIQVDKAELMSTQHLVDHIERLGKSNCGQHCASLFRRKSKQDHNELTHADVPEVVQVRILRHYFLKSYGLPELFPFSKYLRQAQDNQISHMIEVEITTWMVLLLIAWGLEAASAVIREHGNEEHSIVIAFLLFTWISVLLNIAISAYFAWAVNELVDSAVDTPSRRANRFLYLDDIAQQEKQAADREFAADAIAVMESVREREQRKRVKRTRNALSKNDKGFQLVSTLLRKVSTRKKQAAAAGANADGSLEQPALGLAGTLNGGVEAKMAGAGQTAIELRWFSRKAWHFVVMATLMLNALYAALFCQCVLYQMRVIYYEFGLLPTICIPLPLLINAFVFQPRILRNFILVSSILRVDDTALGEVIDHFTETVQLRAAFVQRVHAYLESTHQTVDDIRVEFGSRDPEKSGFLDAEDVRLVLARFGFELSYFRFNSVAKLLFDLHGFTIEYAQVLRLLEIGRSDEVRALTAKAELLGDHTSSAETTHAPPLAYVHEGDILAQPSKMAMLLRAKSSAANSLYRMEIDREPRGPHGQQPDGDAQYLRI